MQRKPKIVYRIIDNPTSDEHHPFALVDPDDQIVVISHSLRVLADLAFDRGADEVRHEEGLVAADVRFR